MGTRISLFFALGIGILLHGPAAAIAQPPAQFEVASVKPNASGDAKAAIQTLPGGRFIATNVTLRQLIRDAYQLQDSQITDGPAWLDRDRFDIVAKAQAGAGDPFQPEKSGAPARGWLMLRALLAERFGLAFHTDTKELPVYWLVANNTNGAFGPQLKRAEPDCNPPTPPNRPTCAMRVMPGTITAGGATLKELAAGLSPLMDRIVQDRTGLGGPFAFTLRWTPDTIPPGFDQKARAMGLPSIDPNGPALVTSVREQLGLRLDAQKGPVDVLVIDRAERPKAD